MGEYRIDPELNDVLPELSDEDYKALEQSLLTDGFKGAPIMVWGDVIVDGHNRYAICKKYDIPYEVKNIEFENKEEAIRWMVRQQIGRRTLTPLQRIKIVEQYRPFYKKKAEKNKSANGGNKKSELQNSSTPLPKEKKIDVRAELANDANVSTDTYSKGLKILKSGDQSLITQTMNGEKTINKAYTELKEKQTDSQEKNAYDVKAELDDLKKNRRKEVAQKLKAIREQGHMPGDTEYEEVRAEQFDVELQINKLENTVQDRGITKCTTMLSEIKERYNEYLSAFQQDINWLSSKEFYQNNEEVTGKVRSDLQNCLEKLKGISDMMHRMTMNEFGDITIDK